MMRIEITDNSGLVKEELEEAALRALEKCGQAAEDRAKGLCAVDTGELRDSITHRVETGEPAAYIGTGNDHGIFVELGTGEYGPGGRQTPWVYQDAKGQWHLTHGQRARPFLKPAVADHPGTYRSIIEEELHG